MITFWKNFFLALLTLFILAGCGDNGVTELQQWMDKEKKESRVVISKISEPKVYVPIAYSGKSQSDPFSSSKLLLVLARMKAESDNGLRPDMERRREVLEAFPLDTLKMVGVIEKSNVRQALIQVDKTIYQAKMGNYIGQNFGVITKITDGEIEVKEIIQDASGEWTERKATLELLEAKK